MNIKLRYDLREQAPFFRRTGQWAALHRQELCRSQKGNSGEIPIYHGNAGELAVVWYGKEMWQHSLDALLYTVEVDPFKQWLKELPTWITNRALTLSSATCSR